MKISHTSLVKITKNTIFSITFALLAGLISTQSHAEENSKLSLLNANNLFRSCSHSQSGSTYCWSNEAFNASPTVADQSLKSRHKSNLAQRIAAASLGLILELTTNQTFNKIEIQ